MSEWPESTGPGDFNEGSPVRAWLKIAAVLAALAVACGVLVWAASCLRGCTKAPPEAARPAVAEKPPPPPPDLHNPVRSAPASFPPDSNLPRGKEIYASGPIDLATFNPTNDLVRFEDPRVWFNSDTKRSADKEDDHLIHRNMEVPLRRMVNLLAKRGGTLKIHDAYRPAEKNKIHMTISLHCEGRAVDLTCEKISLSDLAKLAWQSGFDFVLYEKPVRSGVHLHCSVKRSPDAPLPPRPPPGSKDKKD